ncbi:MAG: DUF4202 domain-containing protein [Verrucomicrobiae bacterium]|nr:DUF4202 domain-containing protein [Verrucomicrobiae bacterium]NNJ85819.1 DUF4202 domain-containing protein [Akkermansiaceae bacterium]
MDPNRIKVDGISRPKALVFAERLTEEVLGLDPEASEPLRLASRCQHICRWQVPRDTQPMGRVGYLKWRAGLKKFHADKSAEILRQVGYDDQTIARVVDLNLKKNLASDPDCQTLEDALCLVFLKYQFDEMIEKSEQEKMVRIVRKTWAKMSEAGQKAAAQLDFSEQAAAVLKDALGED